MRVWDRGEPGRGRTWRAPAATWSLLSLEKPFLPAPPLASALVTRPAAHARHGARTHKRHEAHARRPHTRAGRAMLRTAALTAATLARLVAVAEALPQVLLH